MTDDEARALKAARATMEKAAKESVQARKVYADACTEYARLMKEITGATWEPNILRAPEWQSGV